MPHRRKSTNRRRHRRALLDPLEPRRLLTTWYVDASSPAPTPDGSSWSTAYTDLQLALAAATSGDTIKVAQGTYKPTTTTNTSASFRITKNLSLYAGYAGSSSPTPDARDHTLYPSILSGDIGVIGMRTDNSNCILYSDSTVTSTIDGFTITAGYNPYSAGAGLYIAGDCSVVNCAFTDNYAENGAAIHDTGDRSGTTRCDITACTFTDNSGKYGGAVYIDLWVNPTLLSCTFTSNTGTYGGAIYNNSSGRIYYCTFTSNSGRRGGAIFNNAGSSTQYPAIRGCTFTANTCTIESGGAIYNAYAFPDILNCRFLANSAPNGGAIYSISSSPRIVNSIFVGNSAAYGGAFYDGGSATIINCTFVANSASQFYSAITVSSHTTVSSCIVRGNYGGTEHEQISSYVGSVEYSDVEGGCPGTANIDADPLFARLPSKGLDDAWGTSDDDYGDLRISAASPVVDAGNFSAFPATLLVVDLADNPRVADVPTTPNSGPLDPIDMGAYEAVPALTANAGGSKVILQNGTLTLTGRGADDAFGSQLSYAWEWSGDGSFDDAAGASVSFPVASFAPGLWSVSLRVTDNYGRSIVDTIAVRILPITEYVDAAANGAGTGADWQNAFTDLADALAIALPGQTIRVAGGTFKPTTGTGRTLSFALKSGVALYGGYAGSTNPSNQDTRDFSLHPTVLSGDIGTLGVNTDNSFFVATASATDATAILDGFTIRDGGRGSIIGNNTGGGLYISGASPDIRNCTFTANIGYTGAGIYNYYASPTISDCTFTANTAQMGAGIYNYYSTATVSKCTFSNNTIPYGGGGAAIASTGSSTLTVLNSSFLANAGPQGGAISTSSPCTIVGCLFVGNSATTSAGGAIATVGYKTTAISVINCSFAANSAAQNGGALYSNFSSPTLMNCLVWGNTSPANPQIYAASGAPSVTDSDIQSAYPGAGNLSADPRFYRDPSPGPDATWGTADDDYGDLRLLPDSPCLDAGSNAALPAGTTTDLAGRPRIADFPGVGPAGTAVVDMGAYEASTDLGDLHVAAGQTVALPAGGYAFTATQLIVDPGGTLDLTDDSLLIQYDGASPLAVVRSALASGYHNGAWTGTGITSSAARATPHRAVGYAEAASIGLTTFAGRPVDGPALLLKYTLAGDATLDGRLNGDDFALPDRGRARGGFDNWVHGDFDYDAAVTDADLSILDAAFAPPPPPPAPIAATIPPAPAGADTTSTPVTTAVLTPDDPIAPVPPPAPAPTNQPTHPKHHHHKAKHARKHVRAAGHEAKHAKPAHAAGAKPKAKPAHAGPLHKLDLRPYFARPQRRGR